MIIEVEILKFTKNFFDHPEFPNWLQFNQQLDL